MSRLGSAWNTVVQRLPCVKRNDEDHPKTVNVSVGFFFLLNYGVGTGFLGMPFAFFHAGILVSAITLLVAGFATWAVAIWVLEVMARAQAIFDYNQSEGQTAEIPNFQVLATRKFEFSELCEIFIGRWAKYVYQLVITAFTFLSCLAYCTVAGSAWAVNLPLHFADVRQCSESEFHFHTLPADVPCRNAYWFCLFLFGCIVLPLSMIGLREQTVIQVIWGTLRLITIGTIVIFCIVNLITTGQICTCTHPWPGKISNDSASDDFECDVNITYRDAVVHFNVHAWMVAIPIMIMALNFHQGLPFLTHPLKQKKHLGTLIHVVVSTLVVLYMSVGVVVPLWWKECIIETCSLNWAPLTHPPYHLALRILSYILILFPSVDVISIFPLMVLTMVNNLFVVIFRKDSAQAHETWKGYITLQLLKLISALVPLLVAMAVSNLVDVLKFAGLVSLVLTFIFPAILQLTSQWICKKTFAKAIDSVQEMQDDSVANGLIESNGEMSPLVPPTQISPSLLYMTPYSNIFSYWPAVSVIGLVGVALLLLSILGIMPAAYF